MAISWEELRNADAGQDMGSFPRNVARAAKDAVCSVNSLYPDWYVSSGLGGLTGSPLVRDLCRRNRPPASVPNRPGQAVGGQCPVRYNFQVTFYGTNNDNSPYVDVRAIVNVNALGPLSWSYAINAPQGQSVTVAVTVRDVTGTVVGGTAISAGIKKGDPPTVRFIRVDGQPDTCGDGPPPPIVVPPPEVLFVPTPVPTGSGPNITLPIVIPVGVFVGPKIQVQVTPTLNIDIGPDKVEFSPNISFPSSSPRPSEPQLPPGQPQRPPVQNTDECPECPEVDLQPVIDRLELIKKYTRRPKTTLQTQSVGSGGSVSATLPDRTKYVTVDVTVQPLNVRTQSGGGQAPNVAHQGWCAVGRGGKYGERIPLSYGANCFVVPEGCDSFSLTMYDGGAATVSAVVESDLQECKTYECG